MNIGFLGLGRMGAPIAAALAELHAVVAFDPEREQADMPARVRLVPRLAEAVAGADVVISVLPGAAEFAASYADIATALRVGSLWIDCTTNDPRLAGRAADQAQARGGTFVSAAISGDPESAQANQLHFALSGASEGVAWAARLLTLVAAEGEVRVVGERAGDADVVKLLSNLLWFEQVVAVTEALSLGERLGLPASRLLGLLAEGPGTNLLLSRDYPAVLRNDYRATFGIDRIVEQLELVSDLASENEVPFELADVVMNIHRRTLERFGPKDGELLAAALLREDSGDVGPANQARPAPARPPE